MMEAFKEEEAGSRTLQYLAAAGANLGILALGMSMGWTSPILPKLTDKDSNDNPFGEPITSNQESWIVSLLSLGAAIGPLYSGWAAGKIGRKWTILASGIPLLIGWILIATAKDVTQLYVARVIMGLAVGQLFTIVPMYVGEIAEKEIRGALGSFLALFIVLGFLLTYCIGPYVNYLVLSIVSIVPVILFMLLFSFMPDSPVYLVGKGHKKAAQESLKRLRGKTELGVQTELDELQIGRDKNMQNVPTGNLLTSKANLKALYLSCGLVVFQQLCGINVVLFNLEPIFDAANTGLSPAISTIIVGVVQVFGNSVTPLLVDRLGRRLLLLMSGFGLTISLILLGVFFILDDNKSSAVEYITWLPLTSLVLFMCAFCLGFGPLPWIVIGEIFDPSVKSIASTIVTTLNWLISFVITKYFGAIAEELGMHYAFWIFALCTLGSFIFVFFLLPETKGKSLREIQDLLTK